MRKKKTGGPVPEGLTRVLGDLRKSVEDIRGLGLEALDFKIREDLPNGTVVFHRIRFSVKLVK